MARIRLRTALAACLAGAALALASCGDKEPGIDEPAREGLAINVGGVDYNVYITRELNLNITPDKAYYEGPAAAPGKALYGVFLKACNPGDEERRTTNSFVVEDNQGNEFEPIELPDDNEFAYRPATLGKDDCAPEPGSVAEQGPTGGSMLLFEFPLANTENRPLELVVKGPFDPTSAKRETAIFELDL